MHYNLSVLFVGAALSIASLAGCNAGSQKDSKPERKPLNTSYEIAASVIILNTEVADGMQAVLECGYLRNNSTDRISPNPRLNTFSLKSGKGTTEMRLQRYEGRLIFSSLSSTGKPHYAHEIVTGDKNDLTICNHGDDDATMPRICILDVRPLLSKESAEITTQAKKVDNDCKKYIHQFRERILAEPYSPEEATRFINSRLEEQRGLLKLIDPAP